MKSYTFYHPETGALHPQQLHTDDPTLVAKNTPAGHIVIEGKLDPMSQKVDIPSGKVVDYQPPQPSADHEWSSTSRRWQLTAAAQAVQEAKNHARRQISSLEAQQARPLRELALDPTNAAAKARLAAIEAQIVQLREVLTSGASTVQAPG